MEVFESRLSDRELFGNAIWEGLARKYERELAECTEDAFHSVVLDQRVHGILHPPLEHTYRMTKKKWVIVLLVAALLLCGCAVFIYRRQIGNILEERFPDYFGLSFEADSPADVISIEENYVVTYVPEGYHQTKENIDFARAYYEWEDEQGHKIIYSQSPASGTAIVLGIAPEEAEVVQYHGLSIYYRDQKAYHFYLWNDGVYVMYFKVSDDISRNEVLKMIDSLQVME